MKELFGHLDKKYYIKAKDIRIGKGVTFGDNFNVNISGNLTIGDRCHFGDNVKIKGNHIKIGNDFFCSGGLQVGGGGFHSSNSNLTIGDRCTVHNNHINICEPVVLGNDVGLSPEVTVMTHGYWLSVLDGFPAKFDGVNINSGSIIGWRSIILMGINIGENVVVGSGSVVTKNLRSNSVYAGNPSKFIREIVPLTESQKLAKLEEITDKYTEIARFHGIHTKVLVNYPIIYFSGCEFNVENFVVFGEENEETDDFRDYLRKWGLRFYTDRPFKSID